MTNITTQVINEIIERNLVELDRRENSDESVELLWSVNTNQIYIRLTDKHADVSRLVLVPNEKARDAFNHPYVYLV